MALRVTNNMEGRSKLQCSIILLVPLVLLISHSGGAEKVMLVPLPVGDSRWFTLAKIGQALVDRGHDVTAVVSEDIVDKRRAQRPEVRYETFQDQGTTGRLQGIQEHLFSTAEKVPLYQLLSHFYKFLVDLNKQCDLLLGDLSMVGRLKAAQYGVVISDPYFPCGAIIASLIDAPHIATMRFDPLFLDKKATAVPVPLAYVPILSTDFTDHMTFPPRLQNVAMSYVLSTLVPWLASVTFDGLVRKYVSYEQDIQCITSRTDLWLYQTDLVLDFPRPSMPNMVDVGGLNVREVVPLPQDMESFMQSSGEDGVIAVSFGSMVKTMLPNKAEVFAAAFARLRQKVVWWYEGEKPAGLGSNTKQLDWLPQNDLLGHQKTRAFITHAGYNGLQEALHHGVPMVCLPLFADQPANAARVVARGLGVKLDFSTVTADQLYEAILHVLTNTSYRETAARLSRLHRDQPQSPMQRAVCWIEHVIKHGGLPHLRARAVELPFYQYYLLDVATFLLAVCSAVLGTVWCSCSLMCRKCCPRSYDKIKSQ